MTPQIHALCPTAAEIVGFDCARPLVGDVAQQIHQAFQNYPVLIFRDQTLSAPELAAFSRQFGRLEEYKTPVPVAADKNRSASTHTASLQQTNARETPDQMLYLHPEDLGVLIMTNETLEGYATIGIVDNAEMWHADASHKIEPYKAVIVHVIQNPASGGGDTEFCDLRLAYDALPDEVKKAMTNRQAIHHWSKAINPRFAGALSPDAQKEGERIARMIPEMRQPLVCAHPETRRPFLYLSPRFTLRIDGLDQPSSDAVLNELLSFIDNPQFIYRHEWKQGDLMIWDNRCLNHRVRAYDERDTRRRHRVTVAGERLIAAS